MGTVGDRFGVFPIAYLSRHLRQSSNELGVRGNVDIGIMLVHLTCVRQPSTTPTRAVWSKNKTKKKVCFLLRAQAEWVLIGGLAP